MRGVEGFEKLGEELLKKEAQIARLIESQKSLGRLGPVSLDWSDEIDFKSRPRTFGFEMVQNPDGPITLKK